MKETTTSAVAVASQVIITDAGGAKADVMTFAEQMRQVNLMNTAAAVLLQTGASVSAEALLPAEPSSGLLRETGVPAERLELELTESSVMSDPERALAILNSLRKTGIRLAIDAAIVARAWNWRSSAQGYFLPRPLPAEDFERWLAVHDASMALAGQA